MILRTWILMGILGVVGNARHFYDDLVRDDSGATHQSVQRFLRAMNRLNFIEGKLLDVEEVKSPSSIPYLDDLFAAHDEHGNPQRVLASQDKPEEKPFLFEGDMLLTSKQMDEIVMNVEHQLFLKDIGKPELMMRNRFKRTLTSNIISRWTELRIPYRIHPERGPNKTLIEAGIKAWTDATCLEFEEKTGGLLQPHIVFIKGSGCYSNVGKSSMNGQYVSIGRGCENPYIVAHEIGHTLGFFHEQGRYDRDGHINIAPKNIHVGFLSQFTKQDPESMTTLSVPYDVGSVMHYDQYSFSYNGHPSIRAIDPNYQMTMGQRQELTFNDVKKINLAYCPFRCLLKLDCQYSGYTDPKDCSKCRCPSGLSGQTCSKALRTASKCGRLYHTATSEIKTLSFEGKGECNFLIKAKDGAKIRLHWEKLFIFESQPCQNSYVEIKYHKDLGTTGARFCSTDIKQKDINSAISTVLVLYRSKSLFTSFKLTFSSDEPAPSRSIFSQSMAYFSNFFHSIFHSEKGKDSDDSDNFINSSNEEYDEEEPLKIDDDKKKVSGVVQQKVPDEKKKLNEAIDETVLPKSGEKLVLIKEKVDENHNEQKEKAIEGKPDESWVAEAESSVEDDKEFNNGTVDDIIILNDDKKGKLEETTSTSRKTYTIRDDVSNTTVLDVQTEATLTTDLTEQLTKAQTAATTNDKDTSTALPDASTEDTTLSTSSGITKLAEAENETTTEVVEENLNVTEVAPITPSGKINPSTEFDDNFTLTEKVPESTSTTSESIPEQEEEETEPSQTSKISSDSVTTTTVDYTSIGIEIRRAQAKNSNEIIEMGSGDDTDLIEYTVQREEEVIKSSAKSSADEILEALKAEPDLIVIPNPQLRECKNNALTTTPRPISTTMSNSVDQSTVLISHSVDEITRIPFQDTDELIEGSGTR